MIIACFCLTAIADSLVFGKLVYIQSNLIGPSPRAIVGLLHYNEAKLPLLYDITTTTTTATLVVRRSFNSIHHSLTSFHFMFFFNFISFLYTMFLFSQLYPGVCHGVIKRQTGQSVSQPGLCRPNVG